MRIRRLWPALLCAVLIALIWLLGFGRGEIVFPGLEKNGLTFYRSGNKSFSLEDGDSYGVLNGGPGFTLPAGKYRVQLTIDSDGDNLLYVVSSNQAQAEPAALTLPAYNWNNSLTFELKEDARDLQLLIDFQQGTYLRLHNVDLVMTGVTDGAWSLTLLAVLACALYMLLRSGRLNRDALAGLMLMAAAVLTASVPALRDNLYGGHDTLFHQMRLHNVADALRSGQFPVRMGGYGYNGYGSAVSIFYPDVFLYGPALMMLAGASVQCAVRVYVIAMNAVSAAAMYACGRRIFASKPAGVCASVFYTLASYRLVDVYVRDALGEYTAMAVLPLFVLGLWEVLYGDKARWRTLAAGAAAVFLSHMLSTVLCAVLAVIMALPALARIVREKRIGSIVKAVAATALLCAFVLVPLLDYSMQGIGDSGTFSTPVSENALQLMELFVTQEGFATGIGCALLLGTAALVYAALTGRGEKKKMRIALTMALLGAAFALAATDVFPWARLERLSRGLINYLQFPWRLLMFADLFLALAAGFGAVCFAREKAQKELAMLLALVLCVVCAYPQIGGYAVQDETHPSLGERNADAYIRYKSYTDVITASYLEYALEGSDLSATRDQTVEAGGAELTAYHKEGTRITAQVKADTDAVITLPLFGFDGYRAEVDGEKMALALGKNNRLQVILPAGTQGELAVWFGGRPVWRIAEAVSLCTALALVLLYVRRRRTDGVKMA